MGFISAIMLPALVLAAAPQGDASDRAPIPGDDSPLRSQAFVRQLQEGPAGLAAEGEARFSARDVAGAFGAYRKAVEDAAADWRLLALNGGDRLYTDLTAHLRRRAASLAGPALEAYLADAERVAAAAIDRALTRDDLVVKSSAVPRTARASAALEAVAASLLEAGDLCGARAALERLLASGAGAPEERARWRLRAAALAAELGDAPERDAPEAEASALVRHGGVQQTLRQALEALATPRGAGIPPGTLKERWRARLPARPLPAKMAEPVERIAGRVGDRLVVQTASELLVVKLDTGEIAGRADVESAEPSAPREPGGLNPLTRAIPGALRPAVGYPGRRRARPSCEDRLVAVTSGGVLRVFELEGGEPRLLWSKGSGFTMPDVKPPGSGQESEVQLYCDGALLVGGRLFAASVLVGGDSTAQIECFEPVTGQSLYKRTLSKGNVLESSQERRFAGRLEVVFPEPLAYRGGRVFVSTGVGVVASIDPLDGEVEYLLRLQRSEQPSAYDAGAVAAAGPRAFVCPQDSDFGYALEARLDRELDGRWPLPFAFDGGPLSRKDARNDTLFKGAFRRPIGARGSRVFFLGNVQVTRRRIQSFDFATRMYLDNEFAPGEEVLGLPAIASDAMFVPTNHGVVTLDLTNGIRDVTQTPLPRAAAATLPLRGEEILGDLTAVAGGVASLHRDWIVFYEPAK
jgi:hypothetical protein